MTDADHPTSLPQPNRALVRRAQETRERVIARLSDHFAHGSAIMGGFADVDRAPANPDPDAPLLRVRGLTMMGGVNISMRLPGESERGARRRERHALRADRREQRLLDRQR